MTIDETQEEIIKEFEKLNGVMEKYNYLTQLGRKWPSIGQKYKTEDNLIRGCQVTTWYHLIFQDGRLFFEIDSLSGITKGFIALLIRIFFWPKTRRYQKG